jgi:FMN phosphatase YigB (HAD superfamily)
MTPPPVDWQRIRAVVFDVDGTLYAQRPLRLRMARELALRCLARPATLGEARILRTFRAVREELAEEEAPSIGRPQYERTAERLRLSTATVEAVVAEWIHQRPLRHLAACRQAGARRLFTALRQGGRRIGVWSDYPAPAKLRALGLAADASTSADDPEVDRLKPQPAGLARVLELLDVPAAEALMIGDRDDRDGEAARRLGCPYLLLNRRPTTPSEFAGYAALSAGLAGAEAE